jgi:hypothetical protein
MCLTRLVESGRNAWIPSRRQDTTTYLYLRGTFILLRIRCEAISNLSGNANIEDSV